MVLPRSIDQILNILKGTWTAIKESESNAMKVIYGIVDVLADGVLRRLNFSGA